MSRAYPTILENDDGWSDWIQPVMKNYKMQCCDCGLVHSLEFKIYKGRVQFRASRNKRATSQVRRWRKK